MDDLADACVFVLEHYSDEPHLNVGAGAEVTIGEAAGLVAEVVGYRGTLTFDQSRPDGMPRKLLEQLEARRIGMASAHPVARRARADLRGVPRRNSAAFSATSRERRRKCSPRASTPPRAA